ncbi:DUF6221 family protein [Streptomyces sp. H27-G5]|uniref:DUF6221 family protein n=1 Tax=Streptomyces sp. H27-G5 TaxID=2996698 RepID=UPI00227165A0|nr:DUF6221 family protein [Streptomyces sp. H27-G5]MCY0917029.1 DUF6221 family protein [Streptomyces sp. H27-G5]
MTDPLVEFVRARLEEGRDSAHATAHALARNAETLHLRPERAVVHAQGLVTAAEARIRLFEETVCPYLWVDGRAGRLADLQLRLLACEHTAHADYRPEWAPAD